MPAAGWRAHTRHSQTAEKYLRVDRFDHDLPAERAPSGKRRSTNSGQSGLPRRLPVAPSLGINGLIHADGKVEL
ncbi:hypothetical protein HSB1_13680 [Halogranum salarium B-1]|uniref:Uncharacterized protein n=1 Tax=Halogranum salarium B-1 TaxID=1210908 RepID=J2ZJ80_9EURY|nr:hypothetical protein HSB1_13680 [Halogranum salarium B-1]